MEDLPPVAGIRDSNLPQVLLFHHIPPLHHKQKQGAWVQRTHPQRDCKHKVPSLKYPLWMGSELRPYSEETGSSFVV